MIADAVTGLGRDVAGPARRRTTSPARSSDLGRRARAEPPRRADEPWQLAKDESRADELDRVLYDLADGLRAVAVALSPYLPETSARILDRARAARRSRAGTSSRRVVRSRPRGSRPPSRSSRASTSRPRPRDRYACAPRRVRGPAVALARAARATPASIADRHGRHRDRLAAGRRSRSPTATTSVFAVLGIHPHQAGGREARAGRRAPRAARARQGRRRRRDGPRLLPRPRAAETSAAALRGAARRSPPSSGSPSSSTTATRTTTRPRVARRVRRDGRPALLLVAGAAASRRSSAATTSRSPATSPTRRRATCGRRPRASRPTGSWPRPTARTSPRSRVRGRPNEPANVVHTLAALAAARGEDADELGAQIDANAAAAFSLP